MFLLDTDIIIYSLKGLPKVVKNIQLNADAPKALSVISYGELVYGAYKSVKVSSNLAKVHRLRDIFPVIELSASILECFGSIKAHLSKKGITVDDFDLLIGSTAITCGYTLVTNNEKHFNKIPDLMMVNWTKDL